MGEYGEYTAEPKRVFVAGEETSETRPGQDTELAVPEEVEEDKEQEIAERIIGNPLLVFMVEGLCDMAMCSVGSQVLFKQVSTPYAEHAWNVHQDSPHIELRGFAS